MAADGNGISLEEEYKKNTGITRADVTALRKWLETQPHLPAKYITDLDLILVYHCCNRSFSVTKQILDLHYTLKTLFPNYFKDRVVDEKMKEIMKNILFTVLPTRTQDGNIILFVALVNSDPKVFNSEEFCRALLMVLDLWQYKEGTWPGMILVYDLQNLSLGHISRIEIQSARNFLYFLQEAAFLKLKGLHFINAPSFTDKVLFILKPFLKKELSDTLHIHTAGAASLEKFIFVPALPKDAGGEYKSFEECQRDVAKLLQENAEFFIHENKKRVNEALRAGKQKSITDFFGSVEGSFKSLAID